jgi:oligopeptide transport system substrate-binding protein
VKLSKPAPYFHTILGIWVAYPAKQELIEAGGDQWWADAKNQIGNGPYIMQDLEAGQKAVFVPNPNYWGGKAKTNIEYSYITDSAVATEAYKNDEFDIVALPPEDLASVQADPVLSKQAMIYPGACTTALQFRNFTKPFDDPKVRQAFAYALDRDRWVKDIFQGLAAPTMTWIPPGFPGFKQGESRYKYDPKAALKAIADSTYKSVDKLPPIVLTFSDTPRNRTRNEWLGARFKEVFGDALQVELKPVEATAYTAKQKDKNSDLQMFLGGWCADYPDQQNWLSVYFNGASTFAERIGYNSAAFNKLTEQADKELNTAKRTQLYAQAQDTLIKELPVAFFYNSANAYMVKPWVKGIKTTPQDSDWPGSTNPLTIDIVK